MKPRRRGALIAEALAFSFVFALGATLAFPLFLPRDAVRKYVMKEPATIQITYTNGTVSKFTRCSAISETETKLTFKGTKEGDKMERTWTIMLDKVLEFSQLPE